jgi:hypothetical protein
MNHPPKLRSMSTLAQARAKSDTVCVWAGTTERERRHHARVA